LNGVSAKAFNVAKSVKSGQNARRRHIDADLHKFPGVGFIFVAQSIDESPRRWLEERLLPIGHERLFRPET
jgi:hypothetical protein